MIQIEFVVKGTFYRSFDVQLPITVKDFEILEEGDYDVREHIFDLLYDNDYLNSSEKDIWKVNEVTIHEENDDRGPLLIEELFEE
jgi:hypothetical protein